MKASGLLSGASGLHHLGGMGGMGGMNSPVTMIAASALPVATNFVTRKIATLNNKKARIFIEPGDELLAQARLLIQSYSVEGRVLTRASDGTNIANTIGTAPPSSETGKIDDVTQSSLPVQRATVSTRVELPQYSSGPIFANPMMLIKEMPVAARMLTLMPGANIMRNFPGIGPFAQPVLMVASSTLPMTLGVFTAPRMGRQGHLGNAAVRSGAKYNGEASGNSFAKQYNKKVFWSKQFPVIVTRKIESAYTFKGDPFEGVLDGKVWFSDTVSVPKGSIVLGHVIRIQHSRRLGSAMLSKHDRFRRNASFTVQLDEMITPSKTHLQIAGSILPQFHVFNNDGNFKAVEVKTAREIVGVEDLGNTASTDSTSYLSMSARMALQGIGGNAISFGAMPLIMGVVGAAVPSAVSGKPIEVDETSRTKGFVLGATGQVPGGFVVRNFIYKGDDFCLDEGDELLAEAQIIKRKTTAVIRVQK